MHLDIKPIFYSLTGNANDAATVEFKLDGLAWNFLLCTPDKLKYPLLIDALIDVISITDITQLNQTKTSGHTLCSVRYCFNICCKLLLGLPPSTVHVEELLTNEKPNLHSLIWCIRCPSSHYLIVNSLIKQGMYTQFAETLWNNVTDSIGDINFSIKQTLFTVKRFNAIEDKGIVFD